MPLKEAFEKIELLSKVAERLSDANSIAVPHA